MFLVAVAFGAGCGVVLVNLEHPTFGKVVAVPLMLFAGLFLVGLALTTRRHS
jgi:hypothetical protein